jgi:hypothetical protein
VSVGTSSTSNTAETIYGVKTFDVFPKIKLDENDNTPSPTANNQFATKKYVDDNAGGSGDAVLDGGTTGTQQDFTGFNKFSNYTEFVDILLKNTAVNTNTSFNMESAVANQFIQKSTYDPPNPTTGGVTNLIYQFGGIANSINQGASPLGNLILQNSSNSVIKTEGTLRVGDPFITGVNSGRIRALLDEHGQRIKEAGPSRPVQVLGLPGVPQAGDIFAAASSEREAKDLSQRRQLIKREQDHRKLRTVTLSDLNDRIQQGKVQDLRVVVKGDVDGSVEAISQELGSITHDEVRVKVIHSAVGSISESDVLLAAASDAILIGFHVQTEPSARELASREGIEIRNYKIIYEVVEEVRAGLSGLLVPTTDEQIVGRAEVRQIFTSTRTGTIGGCMMQSGTINRNNQVRIIREGEAVFTGGLSSLRRFKDDVREVAEGFECGMGFEGFNDLHEGDIVEAMVFVETARTL